MEWPPENCLSEVARGADSDDVWDLGKDGKTKRKYLIQFNTGPRWIVVSQTPLLLTSRSRITTAPVTVTSSPTSRMLSW